MEAILKRKPEEQETVEKGKNHMFYISLPGPLSERLRRQSKRLSCSISIIGRMAVVKFLEEEEARERNLNQSYGGVK